jgi:class 3 adenylate cyclase
MNCSSCDFENADGLKFCVQCGAPAAKRCANCGFTNPPTARFCGECAAQLNGTPARQLPSQISMHRVFETEIEKADKLSEGERKTVTALFADIKGSTELMEPLDPEEAREIVDPVLGIMVEAVRRYEGYVVQSTGDGVFALFGAPVAREDHPQRAVHAALAMQQALKEFAVKLEVRGRTPVAARVGLSTGEVVLREIPTGGHAEYTPIGHTANLAARLQAIAPSGSIAVSDQTRVLVEGYFELQPLGALRVKGLSAPVDIYEVTGPGPLQGHFQVAVKRGLTKFGECSLIIDKSVLCLRYG